MKTAVVSKNIKKRFSGQTVLNGVNFTLCEGEIAGLLGANGAGKSTLMKICVNLLKRNGGKLIYGKADPEKHWKALYKDIRILLEPNFPPYLTGKEFLIETAILQNTDRSEVDRLLERVGLASSSHKKIKNYSFGMKQRLGLAATLLGKPKVLILDEPFIGLDPEGVSDIQLLLKELAKGGAAILISSHQLEELKSIADRILFLFNGTVQKNIPRQDFNKTVAVKIKTNRNKEAISYLKKTLPGEIDAYLKEDLIVISAGQRLYDLDELSAVLKDLNIEIRHYEEEKFDLRHLFGDDF